MSDGENKTRSLLPQTSPFDGGVTFVHCSLEIIVVVGEGGLLSTFLLFLLIAQQGVCLVHPGGCADDMVDGR